MPSSTIKFIALERTDVILYWRCIHALYKSTSDEDTFDKDISDKVKKTVEEASHRFWNLLNSPCQAALKKEFLSLDQDCKSILSSKESAKNLKATGYTKERYDAEKDDIEEFRKKRLNAFALKAMWIMMCAAKRYGVTLEELNQNIPKDLKDEEKKDIGIYADDREQKWEEAPKPIEADWDGPGSLDEPKYTVLWKMLSMKKSS